MMRKVVLFLVAVITFWVITIGDAEAQDISPQKHIRLLAPESSHSTAFSYYNTTPESPNGQQIAYVRYDRSSGDLSGSLWVYNSVEENHQKIIDIQKFNSNHNGAFQQWVDNRHIAYMDGHKIKVVDIETGNIIAGPIDGLLGHEAHGGRILIVVNQQDHSWSRGLYEFDISTGKEKLLARPGDFQALQSQMPVNQTDEVQHWTMRHAQWSPNGRYIALRLDVLRDAEEPQKLLVTMQADGSDKVIFRSKPMHFQWYDNQTLMGHDHQVEDGKPDNRKLRRWDRSGHFVETLAGVGNHLGASPDRQWFASESWYGHKPVFLNLFREGKQEPEANIFESEQSQLVWDGRAHVNPSFSRDSKRVYFNYPVNDSTFQAAYYEIESAKEGNAKPKIIFSDDF